LEAIKGIGVSPGIAIGRAWVQEEHDRRVAFRTIEPRYVLSEVARIESAIAKSKDDISHMRNRVHRRGDSSAAAIFDFHLQLLSDANLIGPIRDDIERECVVAEYAVAENFGKLADRLREMGSEMFAQKAVDVVDLERRVLTHLGGSGPDAVGDRKGSIVVIAHELTPSRAVELHRARIVAFATDGGGLTGHTSIVARALSMPAVVGCTSATQDISDGDTVIVDGDGGLVIVRPDDALLARYQERAREAEQRRATLRTDAAQPSLTRDSTAVVLLGNIEFPDEISSIAVNGGTGVGLYRTEFMFLTGETAPTEEDCWLFETQAWDPTDVLERAVV
jgi:phosphotransferase system enzyme I (PtsI)